MSFYARHTVHLLAGLCGLVLANLAYAAPINCLASPCKVANGGWVVSTDSTEQDLIEFSFNGTNHLWEEEFHLDFGTSIPMNDGFRADRDIFLTLSLTSATEDEASDTIVTVFTSATLTATITRQLTNVSAGGATLKETLVLANLNEVPTQLWLIEYNDWDLNGNEFTDTVSYNPATQTFTQISGATTATVLAITAPNFYDIAQGTGEAPILINNIVAGHMGNNAGPMGPADVKHAFEYNLLIPILGQVQLLFEKRLSLAPPAVVVTPVPTLYQWGLLVLVSLIGLTALIGLRRRPGTR